MTVDRKELLHFYRHFLRYGNRALGFSGQKSRLYREALRQRFQSPFSVTSTTAMSNRTIPRTNTANDSAINSSENLPNRTQLENTLTFVRNAAAADTRSRNRKNFEYKLLRELLHNEYNYNLAGPKARHSPATTAAAVAATTKEAGTGEEPAANPAKPRRRKVGVELAETRQIYRDMLDELNRTMGMCL